MRRFVTTLNARLLVAAVLLQALVLTLVVPAVVRRVERSGMELGRAHLARSAAQLAESVAQPLEARNLPELERLLERMLAHGFGSAQVVDAQQALVAAAHAPTDPNRHDAPPTQEMDAAVILEGRRIGVVRLRLSADWLAGVRDHAQSVGIWVAVAQLGVAGALLLVLLVALRRLPRVRDTAVAAARGDLTRRATVRGNDDLAEVARAVNALIDLTQDSQEAAGGRSHLFRHFAEQFPLPLLVVQHQRPVFANSAAARLFGAPAPAAVTGRASVAKLFSDAQAPWLERMLRGDLPRDDTLTRCGLQVVRADGVLRWVDCAAAPLLWEGQPAHQLVLADTTAQRQGEQTLEASGEALRAISDAAPCALFISRKADGRLLFANPRTAELFGLEGDVLAHSTTEFYWDPADRAWAMDRFDGTGMLSPMQVRCRRGDTLFWGLVSAVERPFRGERALYTSVLDVTDQVRAEQALAESEARYRTVVELIPAAICVHRGGRIVFTNAAAVQTLGVGTKAELLGRPLTDFVHPAALERVTTQPPQGRAAAAPVPMTQEQFRTGDGGSIDVEVVASRIQFEGEPGVLLVFRDVSGQRRAEEALRRSEELLRTVIQNAPLVLYAIDADGRFLLSEGHELAAVGRRPGEVVGQSAWDVFAEFPERVAMLRRVLAGEAFFAPVVVDGVNFDAYHQPLFDEHGLPNGAIMVSVNTTERRVTEGQLRQAQKMEGVGQLTGGVAHDFNNLLTVVMGNLELLRRLTLGEPRATEYINQATEAAERGAMLTQRLLAFSRKQPLRPVPVDVNRLATNMADLLRPMLGETIGLETVLAGGLWPALVDANQLESTLLNLAVNARDAMPNGGKLTIETANARLDADYAANHEEVSAGQYVMVAVSDTGEGMTAEVMGHAFEPFFTTKEVGQGSGLGLSMIYGFVKQSAGHIKLYSEPGQGTTVKVYLPRAAGPVQIRPASPPSLAGLQGAGQKVLVVEDDESVRELAVAILSSLNYEVIAAADGAAGLELLRQHEDVALLFTDVVLPGGMNGADLAREAALLRPKLKVLFASGYTENAIIHHGRLDDAVELLEKPFRVEALARKVQRILSGV